MTTREKIILALTFITVLFGLYQVFVADHGSHQAQSHGESASQLAEFIEQVTSQIKETMPSMTEKYVIAHSSLPWSRNPFITSLSDLTAEKKNKKAAGSKTTSRPRWTYSGFISLGSSKLAIINGIEYEQGELLMDKGYWLKKISPDHVEIVGIKDQNLVILPFADKK